MSRISIVIPVFNQSFLTRQCLNSILENSVLSKELIIVDNFSTDDTPELLNQVKNQFIQRGWTFEVITNTQNQGFGRACNQGIRAAHGDYIAILNNDTWLMPSWDQKLLQCLEDLKADMVGPFYDEKPFPEGEIKTLISRAKKFTRKNKGKVAKKWVSVLMLFPRKTLDQVGLFDERFFVTYEDTDLRERMDRAGKKYFKVGDCYIWHFSKGTREREALPRNYEHEGLKLFIEKWGFDPRQRENTRLARIQRRFESIKKRLGYL